MNGGAGHLETSFFSTEPTVNTQPRQLSRKASASCCESKRRSSTPVTLLAELLPPLSFSGTNTPSTRKYGLESNALISRSRSTIRRRATDCTRPAESDGFIFFQRMGESSKPTRRSSTLRACWAITRFMSTSLGVFMALRIASLVISWKTIRRVRDGSRARVSFRCHAMASPSRSSSDASHTTAALSEADFRSATTFFLSGDTSY